MSEPFSPLVVELPPSLTAVDAFRRLASLPHVVYFDSAAFRAERGRWSFVTADPYEWFTSGPAEVELLGDPFAALAATCARYAQPRDPLLPPFVGGLAGVFGYELSRGLETLPAPRCDDLPTPALAVGAYDVVAAFDHLSGRACLVSQGWPAPGAADRRERAQDRVHQFLEVLKGERCVSESPANRRPLAAVTHATPYAGISSNLSGDEYLAMVRRGIEYIHAGDVFQVNLSQRLVSSQTASAVETYLRLRERNPAPYAGYFDAGATQVCSASPECFLTIRDGRVETRPIKGTRGRSLHPVADLFAGDDLRASEKDRAENVMIADLLRNDLSKICVPDSVVVEKLCALETYAHVKHLVSVVTGELQARAGPIETLRATFPGGSITGAPKVRAMEIIAELEPTARGPYCGSLAYIGFDGQMDSNILIRTITASDGWLQAPVGGGIVAASNPEAEYRESWHKARGLVDAMVG